MKLYNIIRNNLVKVALPAEECVTDLMFEKGWRVQVPEASLREVAAIGATLWPLDEFYREYLQEEVMSEEDTEYLILACQIYEGKHCKVDADEEEFDEFFSSQPDATDEDEDIFDECITETDTKSM